MAEIVRGGLALLLLLGCLGSAKGLQTERCEKDLGMKSNTIPDTHVTASSYFDEAVNAFNGRAHVERGGGAWCPRSMVHNEGSEYLEINLGSLHILTKIEVQGRFGNGQGKEYAEKYKLQYWREGLGHWITYRNGKGEELHEGNSNTYLAKFSQLSPPVIVSRVRFVPFSDHPRTICMRVEVYGCPYTDGLLSYSMMDGDVRGGGDDDGLRDVTYDGLKEHGWLSGGLGQLTDREIGHTNFRVDSIAKDRGYEWVGWKNDSRGLNPVEITFKFDVIRNFSALNIYVNNFFTRDTMVFSRARIMFSVEGEFYTSSAPIEFTHKADRIFEDARNVFIDLHGATGRYVKVQLFFALRWMMISEVYFESVPCKCNITDDEMPPLPATIETSSDGEKDSSFVPVTSSSSSGLLLGLAVTLGVVFVVVPVILGIYYYKNHLTKSKSKTPVTTSNGVDSRKVSMKMKDLHINMNLSPTSNGYSRAKGKLYGHVHMEEEVAAMYQEPYKGPIHNPGYYTLNRAATPSETPLKALADTDDSVDYAVPDVNMTPPPPFSEVYTPPPPVPLSRPPNSLPGRIIRETPPPPPVPSIPPPPEQQYYIAPRLCQPSNIQGVTGTVIYSVVDTSVIQKEVPVPEIPRHRIRVLENLGEGLFGTVQLCEVDGVAGQHGGGSLSTSSGNTRLVALKSLKPNASEMAKEDFKSEVRVLSRLEDPNIVMLLGVVTRHEPMAMLLEYMEHGDLYQFLRRHVSEGIAVRHPMIQNPNGAPPPILTYGALIYMGTQIASGMKYLEELNFVHRDLAARNCLVGRGLTIKISDFGMSRPLYSSDYYRIEGRAVLPIRWMAWESVLQGRFTTKSDVWAFGVTLWEILTMARRQAYDELSDEGVLENVSHCYHGDGSGMILLPMPQLCPREMYDMLTACWRPNERQRPPFWEIHMFLQRKNLGYSLDYDD